MFYTDFKETVGLRWDSGLRGTQGAVPVAVGRGSAERGRLGGSVVVFRADFRGSKM